MDISLKGRGLLSLRNVELRSKFSNNLLQNAQESSSSPSSPTLTAFIVESGVGIYILNERKLRYEKLTHINMPSPIDNSIGTSSTTNAILSHES